MPALSDSLPAWPRAHGGPFLRGRLRTTPDDFRVWELPLIEPEGDGPHLWLEVCKRGCNTRWVAEQLAHCAGAHPRDVGYAGMKDRDAVTTQWFSVGLQGAARTDWQDWRIPGCEILAAVRHRRKLQTGTLRGNRFRIIVRELDGPAGALDHSLAAVAASGFPNYFGPQRFGHGGANVRRGSQWLLRGGRIKRADRSLYLSAVRSYLFNEALAARVRDSSWNRLLDGEVAMLDGSRSIFACSLPDTDLEQRCAALDLHPTGPLPGSGGERPGAAAGAIEQGALQPSQELVAALDRAGVRADRRSLRVVPGGFRWECAAGRLELEFDLPPGAYATSLLRELLHESGLQ